MKPLLLPLLAAMVAGCAQPSPYRNRYGWQAGKTEDGCVLEDSCGLYPPYRSTAAYCGEPHLVCPKEAQ